MRKFRPSKKVVLTIIGTLALVAIALGAGFGLRTLRDDKAQTVVEEQEQTVEEIQSLQNAGNTDAADAKIDEIITDGNASDAEKYSAYILQGNSKANAEDYAGAIDSYKRALAIQKNYEVVFLLAESYEKAGNTTEAITYYKQAIPLVANSPIAKAEQDGLRNKITVLGGQP